MRGVRDEEMRIAEDTADGLSYKYVQPAVAYGA